MRFIEKQIQTNHSYTKHRQFWWFFFLHSNFHRRSYHCVVFNTVSSSSSSYSLCRAPFTNKIYPQTHKRHKHHVHRTISPYNILLINCMLHSHSSPSYIYIGYGLFSFPFHSYHQVIKTIFYYWAWCWRLAYSLLMWKIRTPPVKFQCNSSIHSLVYALARTPIASSIVFYLFYRYNSY